MQTSNNVILITGGTSGIGRQLVKQFDALGNKIVVAASNEARLADLKLQYPNIFTVACDLGDGAAVRQLIATCLTNHSDINVLINNAGIQYNYQWTNETDGMNKIETENRVNLTSPMQIIYGLLPLLTAKPAAAIVNVSSGLAFAPKKSVPVYCATKAALHSATKTLRYQLEATSVKMFEIIPPLVDTAMTAGRGKGKISPEQLVDEFIRNFRNDTFESNIGKTKLLRLVQRISPKLADALLKNG